MTNDVGDNGEIEVQVSSAASMRPLFCGSERVVVRQVQLSEVVVGDVVAFHSSHSPGVFIVHRVVSRLASESEWPILTKGDDCFSFDSADSDSKFIGIVVGFYRKGTRRNLRTPALMRVGACLGKVSYLQGRFSRLIRKGGSGGVIHLAERCLGRMLCEARRVLYTVILLF